MKTLTRQASYPLQTANDIPILADSVAQQKIAKKNQAKLSKNRLRSLLLIYQVI